MFAGVLLLHLIGLHLQYALGYTWVYGVVPLVDFNHERNVPSVFSTLLLLGSAVLFLLVRRAEPATLARSVWLVLAIAFAFLALDDFAEIHERVGTTVALRAGISLDGHYRWVFPWLALTALLGLFVFKVIWNQPAFIRVWFIVAAVLFLAGAVGLEVVGSAYKDGAGLEGASSDLTYSMIATLEESLEMLGVIALIFALLTKLAMHKQGWTLHLVARTHDTAGVEKRHADAR